MANIEVNKINSNQEGSEFEVTVSEENTSTGHRVTLKESDYQRLTNGEVSPEELVKKSFEFLLEREPKESILSEFDLMLIGRYFPEYEKEITK